MKGIRRFLIGLCLMTTLSGFAQTWHIGSPNAEDVVATLENNTLTISGSGEMCDFFTALPVAPRYLLNSIRTVKIENGVTNIGNFAFYECDSLISIDIPSSVTSIGDRAFDNCSNLTSIVLPKDLTSIGGTAFYGCSSLTSIDIPESVTSIGGSAFTNCSSLTSIVLPSSITTIGAFTFSGCSSLTSIVLPDSLTSIGGSALRDCRGLTSIVLPKNLTNIGDHVFSGCSSLTSITIPKSVTSIKNNAFDNCSSLTSIVLENEFPINISDNILAGKNKPTLYVPYGSGDLYRAADGWKEFNVVEKDNANLQNLSVMEVTGTKIEFTPAFNKDTINYTVNVPYRRTHVLLSAQTVSSSAIISEEELGNKALSVGENKFDITVTTGDGEIQKTYTIVINRAEPSSNADLQSLFIEGLYPAFDPNITIYTVNVPFSKNYIEGYGYTADSKAVANNYTGGSFKFGKNLQVGENTFEITVTAEDGETKKTYTIVVTREPLPEKALTIHLDEPGTLQSKAPEFSRENPVTKLKITGNMDARDFLNLSYDNYMYLTELDLSEVNIVAYEGITADGMKFNSPANEIPDNSFRYMHNLNKITFPKTLTSIGNTVLSGGTTISPPITSLVIPEGVTNIGRNFASFNDALTTVVLPSTLNSLGYAVFSSCRNISVIINYNPEPIDITWILGVPESFSSVNKSKCTLYVPFNSKGKYENAEVWKEFNIVELPNILDNNIVVTPAEENTLITWEPLENAEGYLLKIYTDEEHTKLDRTLSFDANGQFVLETRSRSATSVFTHTLEDLLSGTTYYYMLETLAADNLVVFSQSGEFTTVGETVGAVETGRAPSLQPNITGYYSILGVKLPKEPVNGVYIITYDDGTVEKKIKY